MNSTSGLGPVAAIGVAVAPDRHDHPLPGAAGDRRPLGLLAGRPARRQPRTDRDRRVGAHRPADQPPAAHGLGDHRGRARRARASACSPSRPTAWPAPTPSPTPPTRWSASAYRTATSPPGGGQPMVVIANADSAADSDRRAPRRPGVVPASVGTPPGVTPQKNGHVYLEATLTDRPDSSAARTAVDRARDRPAPDPGRRRRGRRRHRGPQGHRAGLQPRQQAPHPAHPAGRPAHPGGAAARDRRAAGADRDGRAVLRRRARRQLGLSSATSSATPARTPPSRSSSSSSSSPSASTTTSS